MHEKNNKRKSFVLFLVGWGCLVVIIFLVRYFLIQSYRISTVSMEETLSKGDFVLVNKTHGKNLPQRNAVILFISPLLADTLEMPLIVSRCMAIPGDTLKVTDEGYQINGSPLPYPPTAINAYRVSLTLGDRIIEVARELQLPRRSREVKPDGFYINLTSFEEYLLRQELTPEENLLMEMVIPEKYEIILPRKNIPYKLYEQNLSLLENAIRLEAGNKAVFRDGKLILDGVESAFFTFSRNYYWMLSDNCIEAIDSRHLGIIPEDYLVGNVWFCWYSKDKKQIFKWIR